MKSRIGKVYFVLKRGPKSGGLYHTGFLDRAEAIQEARKLRAKGVKEIRIRHGYLSNAPLRCDGEKFREVPY